MPYQLNRNLLFLLLQRERPQAPQIQLLRLQKQSPLQIFHQAMNIPLQVLEYLWGG